MKKKEPMWCVGFQKQTGSTIHILSCKLLEQSDYTEICYQISVNDKEAHALWFRFPNLDKNSISYEVADGVVVMLLSYAMRGGYHIKSAIPMTEKLWFQLTEMVIPQICRTDPDAWKTEIFAPKIVTAYHPKHIATAMSCGVDSFATFFKYSKDCSVEDFHIDSLTFFQNGAHHGGVIGHNAKEPSIFEEQCANVRKYCARHQYPLLEVESNLDAFLSEVFWRDSYHYTHTYRNAGFVLLLQNYIRVYYYSGVNDVNHFHVSLWEDSESYEKWLLPLLSTECTTFFSIATSMNRVQKTEYISRYSETFDHLLVCFKGGNNCGECDKCKRTLMTLDVLGQLDKYSNSFNIQKYQNNRESYLAEMLLKKSVDYHLQEVYKLALERGVGFGPMIRAKEVSIAGHKGMNLLKRVAEKVRKVF